MSSSPQPWESPAAAKERAEELRTALEQYERKEITLKQVLHLLRPEIERIVEQIQRTNIAAGTPAEGTLADQADLYSQNRLSRDTQVFGMLRACLNDAEEAAGMWDRKKPHKR